MEMVLVRKFGPDTLTMDERAPFDGEQVVAQPALLHDFAHVLVPRVKPVASEVERKAVDDFGARQAADAIFRLDQREAAAQLARA